MFEAEDFIKLPQNFPNKTDYHCIRNHRGSSNNYFYEGGGGQHFFTWQQVFYLFP